MGQEKGQKNFWLLEENNSLKQNNVEEKYR